MNSLNYWKRREEIAKQNYITEESEYNRILAQLYNSMLVNIEMQINSFYQKYAKAEKITMAEAMQKVAQMDVQAFQSKAKQYVQTRDLSKQANQELRLYNATMKINRLELLKANIGLEMIDAFNQMQGQFSTGLLKRAADEFERQAGILGMRVDDAPKLARTIVNASFHNADFSTRIWLYQGQLKNELSSLLSNGIVQGIHSRDLARQLERKFKVSKSNAERLMRTEMARVQIAAQEESYKANGYDQYVFLAIGTACPDCLAINGQHFYVADMQSGENAPPMHPNCVLPDTKIIAPDIEAITRSKYSGEIVEIGTPDGTRLSVTPNHIMLTARGWVRAKNIVEGDKIIRYCGRAESVVESNPTNNNSVTTIEELFATLVEASTMPPLRMPVTTEYFKGDVVPDSEVDVIFINSELRHELDFSTSKLISDVLLVGTGEGDERSLTGNCSLAKFLVGAGLVADGIMSGSQIASILLGGSVSHHELVGFRRPSDYDSRLFKTAIDNGAADAEFLSDSVLTDSRIVHNNDAVNIEIDSNALEFNTTSNEASFDSTSSDAIKIGDLIGAFSSFVAFDDVVFVSNKFYSGHVYDTSCSSTLYICNGFLSSNCRCSTAAWMDRAETMKQIKAMSRVNGVASNTKNVIINKAKPIDSMFVISESGRQTYSKQEIVDEMNKSKIGQKVLGWIENSDVKIAIYEDEYAEGQRGDQRGNNIRIFPRNIPSLRVYAQTVIHEMGHYHYDIGQCQHAEAICFGLEKLHITGNEKLTLEEWNYVKKLAVDNYTNLEWEAGGYGDYSKIRLYD
jgi:SPP1 gp7 family putative phage head morphogenesis protein|nr:MAG TPA_asm: minor capsid protein [Caudoviricetes sp.]